MVRIKTEQIWSLTDDDFTTRPGEVAIAKGEYTGDLRDPLRVVRGLSSGDVAIFLGLRRPQDSRLFYWLEQHVGYLVTERQPDGSGLIVPGDTVQADPDAYMTTQLRDSWRALGTMGITFANYSLAGLDTYLEQLDEAA